MGVFGPNIYRCIEVFAGLFRKLFIVSCCPASPNLARGPMHEEKKELRALEPYRLWLRELARDNEPWWPRNVKNMPRCENRWRKITIQSTLLSPFPTNYDFILPNSWLWTSGTFQTT